MRKLFLLFITIITVSVAQAQVSKGSIFIGGEVSFTSISPQAEGAESATSFSIIPDLGFFVSDNIAIGIGLGYEQTEFANITSSAFVAAPFARYYAPLGDDEKWYFFGQLRPSFNFGTTETTDELGQTFEANSRAIEIALSPGFAFFPSERWSIELGIRGLYYEIRDPNIDVDNDGDTEFGFDVNSIQPTLGVRIFL